MSRHWTPEDWIEAHWRVWQKLPSVEDVRGKFPNLNTKEIERLLKAVK